MSKFQISKIDFRAVIEQMAGQFRDLDPNDPSVWPVLPRHALCGAVVCLVIGGLWYFQIGGYASELEQVQAKEEKLKVEFRTKLTKAANLAVLTKQLKEVQTQVVAIETQLPSKGEAAELLSGITRSGAARSLKFELFRPGQVVLKPYYAELPISIKAIGSYHDFGKFASDIALLSRIATISNISITPKSENLLQLDATVNTYRYLEADERTAQVKQGAEGIK
ncbi:MAG: pilus assembly protein PilO [Planctomycetes bacterium]|nr:pilus assembly protein PilO [Planctomycetota bacterium]